MRSSKQKVYDLMNGSYNLEEYLVEESSVVKMSLQKGNTAKSYIHRCWKRMSGYAEDLERPDTEIRMWRSSYQIS